MVLFGGYRPFWCANAAPARGRCCVWESQLTEVPPLLRSASSVRRTPVSIKQAAHVIRRSDTQNTHISLLTVCCVMQFIHVMGEVMCDKEDRSYKWFAAAILPAECEQVSHCLRSCQSNSVCSVTSIRLGELSTQLPWLVSTGGLLLYQQVIYYCGFNWSTTWPKVCGHSKSFCVVLICGCVSGFGLNYLFPVEGYFNATA